MEYPFIKTTPNCTLVPLNYNPTVDYSFLKINYTPDLFQIQSFSLLNNNEDILVTAHTSCGKTLVAEYCIHLQLQKNKRVIYTTPLKTLSNQKYFYFRKQFNTGIITGDIALNTDAPLLIMTTEILYNYEADYVIFDEVHYINDKDRGYVWEECLIKCKGSILCLSATIDNKRELADWLGRQRNKHCYVISTKERIIPLEFVLFYDNKLFNLDGKQINNPKHPNYFAIPNKKVSIPSLITFLQNNNLLPSILFSFSISKINSLSNLNLDLTTEEEKKIIRNFIDLVKLPSLPQVNKVIPLLIKGIGIHYSTLLPLLKETVEFLVEGGLVKVLFATETFAVGVNMPAKSVVFLSLHKVEQNKKDHFFRLITSSEFTQMSGRAGRRGLDKKGTVILINIDKKEKVNLLFNRKFILQSHFKVSYNFVMNNDIGFLRKSFLENDNDKRSARIINALIKEYNSLEVSELMPYFSKMSELFEFDFGTNLDGKTVFLRSNHKCVYGKEYSCECFSFDVFLNLPIDCLCECQCHIKNNSALININNNALINDNSVLINNNNALINDTINDNNALINDTINGNIIESNNRSNNNIIESINKLNINDNNSLIDDLFNEFVNFNRNSVIFIYESKMDLQTTIKIQKIKKIMEELRKLGNKKDFITFYKENLKRQTKIYKSLQLKKLLSNEELKLVEDYKNKKAFLVKNMYMNEDGLLYKGKCANKLRILEDVLVIELLFGGFLKKMSKNEFGSLICALSNRDIKNSIFYEEYLCKDYFWKEELDGLVSQLEYPPLNYELFDAMMLYLDGLSFHKIADLVIEGVFVKMVSRTDEGLREVKGVAEYMGDTDLIELIGSIDLRKSECVRESLYVIGNEE